MNKCANLSAEREDTEDTAADAFQSDSLTHSATHTSRSRVASAFCAEQNNDGTNNPTDKRSSCFQNKTYTLARLYSSINRSGSARNFLEASHSTGRSLKTCSVHY